MTREDLENLVIEATGRSDKLTLIRSAINLALDELSSQHNWSDLQVEGSVTVAAEAQSVDLGTAVTRITEVRVIDGTLSRPLYVRPKTWLVSRCPDAASRSASRPVYGYLEGQNLVLIPRPNQAYEIRFTYFRTHPPLTAPSDILLIRCASSAIAAYATFWVFQAIEKFADAKQWYDTYKLQTMSAKKLDRDDSVIKQEATGRSNYSDSQISWNDYWLDPFCMQMP